MSIVFKNKGVIDVQAIKTFGVSAKENDDAIGFFGTGLKYAIAIILRLNGSITIYAGTKPYKFGVAKTRIRGEQFNIVTMNGRKLGFTTEVGKTWEPWMAFRELYCNATDERGECFEGTDCGSPRYTTIVVDCKPIKDAYDQRDDIILSTAPIEVAGNVEVHNGPSEYIYYRNIRASKLESPSAFTYNLRDHIQLTEDRTIKYTWDIHYALKNCFAQLTNPALLRTLLRNNPNIYESCITLGEPDTVSPQFLEVCREYFKAGTGRKDLENILRIHDPDTTNKLNALILSPVQQQMMNRAIEFLKKLGTDVTEYPIRTLKSTNTHQLGSADNGVIYIYEQAFTVGTKTLAGTLYEEHLHLSKNVHDESRSMQNLLIDTIMTMGETILGEPI